MLKPIGSACNLQCKYCYYLEKKCLYNYREENGYMSEQVLESFIKQYLASQTQQEVMFTWHGGEPLLLPINFYKKALQLQKKHSKGYKIANCIQTNGTLITEDWCKFFKENNWLVGVSIDGPEYLHNPFRINKLGEPTFAKIMKGIELLNKYGVEWNAMAVVNNLNAEHPLEFYNFFKSIECKYIQFTPIVERIFQHPDGRTLSLPGEKGEGNLMEFSVGAEQFGKFTIALFDEWIKNDVGEYFIQLFDSTLANWVGVEPGVCSMAKECGHAGVMEKNGDLYSCDHYVFPEYKLGNIKEQPLLKMMYSPFQSNFGAEKKSKLTKQCLECEYLFACNGGCPKDRFIKSCYGEDGQNYLCKGYKMYFEHVAPAMDFMKRELMNGRPARNVCGKVF